MGIGLQGEIPTSGMASALALVHKGNQPEEKRQGHQDTADATTHITKALALDTPFSASQATFALLALHAYTGVQMVCTGKKPNERNEAADGIRYQEKYWGGTIIPFVSSRYSIGSQVYPRLAEHIEPKRVCSHQFHFCGSQEELQKSI